MSMKATFITLAVIACVLGLIAFFVVFYGGSGNYVVTSNSTGSNTIPGIVALPTTTISSSTSVASSTDPGPAPASTFTSTFTTPPVTWTAGHETLAITGASFADNVLALQVRVTMGSAPECVPIDLRLVVDESGSLIPPRVAQFTFPESGTCNGSPGKVYENQPVTFSVTPSMFPLFITTGGSTNIYFQVATTSANGLDVSIPQHAG